MLLHRAMTLLSLSILPCAAVAADWKPAPAPLMTKWGKQVTPQNAWTDYPRPQLVRKDWANLNGLWDYAITPKAAAKPDKWDGQILVPFCVESSLSGVGKPVAPDQLLWYRRTIETPANWKGRRVLVHFAALDWEATVSLNGKEIGVHRGGSDPFSFDITDALKEGANELIVRVWDPTDQGAQPRGKQKLKPEGIWYTAVTGIWQTVWLEPVPEARIERVTVVTKALPSLGKPARVDIRMDTNSDQKGWQIRARAKRGEKVVFESDANGGVCQASLADAELWTPDSPNLYDLHVEFVRDGKVIDAVDTYFAVRTISAGKDDKGVMRLLLNDKPLFQIGPLDQGWWPDGLLTPPSDEAMAYDLKVLKSIGMNMLRKHIKVEPARYYYHCDKLGLLVWQDMPSAMAAGRRQGINPNAKQDATFTEDEKKQFRAELKAMIDHLRFFPCIVAWVPFNEGWGQHDTNEILKWVKELDPTRLVNGPSGWADRGYGDMKDMHNYPGPGMFPVMPDRVSVLGEFGGLGLPLKGHLWKDAGNWGYQTFKSTDDLRQGYRQLTLRLRPLIGRGLSAAVYTQTTDVEVEVNGLMTYDREIIKLDVSETAKWHKALFGPPLEFRELLATSEANPQKWRYTTAKPADGWEKLEFDAAAWAEDDGGFGTKGTPGAIVRTEWKTADIWVRRSFDLKALPAGEIFLRVHHDDDAEVFINGVLAATLKGYTTAYSEMSLTPAAQKALKAGVNVIAIHCRQITGGQYIDAGLAEVVTGK